MTEENPTRKPRGLRAGVRRHAVTVFVVLAFTITWSVWVPRALVSQGLLTARWPITLGDYWAWGPAVAAVITAGLAGRGALRDLGARLIRWRVPWWWYAIVLLGPAAYCGAVYVAAIPIGLSDQLRPPLPITEGVAAAVPILLVLCLTDGLGEETGWRGFLLPRQLEHLNRLAASLLLGVIWALWHLPLSWTDGAPLAEESPLVLLAELPALSVIFTWVFEHTRGSALIAILLHGAINWWAFNPAPGAAESWQATTLLLVTKWLLVAAVVVAWTSRARRPGRGRLPQRAGRPQRLAPSSSTTTSAPVPRRRLRPGRTSGRRRTSEPDRSSSRQSRPRGPGRRSS